MNTNLAHAVSSATHPRSATSHVDERVASDHRRLDGNYDGLGKSRAQEARDSARALGLPLIASGVVSVTTVAAVLTSL